MATDQKLEDVLYYLIDKTNKVGRRYSQDAFIKAGYDITIDQWLVLKKIWDSEQINQVELADSIFKDTASITRILQILVKKKLVKKDFKEGDKRHYMLSLTVKGEQYFKEILSLVKTIRQQGTANFSDSEKETLKKLLNRVIQNFQ